MRDSVRFVEVALLEPDKETVGLADAYFFPPLQPSLARKAGSAPAIPSKLPARRANLIIYNKLTNETSVWVVELAEVHASARSGHQKGKVVSSQVIPDVQPPLVPYIYFHMICKPSNYNFLYVWSLLCVCFMKDAVELAEVEATVKDYRPFREAMKKRGIMDMNLVMVDTW